jgi:hypothetical protein
MTTQKGLYPVPDEPDAAPQGSVSAPVSALGAADAPLRECPFCGERAIMTTLHANNGRADNPTPYAYVVRCFVCEAQRLPAATPQIAAREWNRRDGEAARVAEAVAAERVRIVAALEAEQDRLMDEIKRATTKAGLSDIASVYLSMEAAIAVVERWEKL